VEERTTTPSGSNRREPTRVRASRGFSFLEILVVLGLFAIVAAMAIPFLPSQISRDKVDDTKLELQQFQGACVALFQDTGVVPSGAYGLYSLQGNYLITGNGGTGNPYSTSVIPNWNGPYLVASIGKRTATNTSLLTDAWNTTYTLTNVDASHLTITSPGPDKTLGTADDLSVTVDYTPTRRKQTLDELKVLNTAIAAYNANPAWSGTPLAPPLANVLSQLATVGLLPATTTDWATDGWGDAYVESPAGVTPVTAVVSTHVNG
jgi:prepilin-type N-terminal cleavage/methylation domain-containing protein